MTQHDGTTVALLGVGQMGAPMARRLLGAGFSLRVWNRSPGHMAPLVDEGAFGARTPAEAASGADFVITMLPDGATVESVMTGEEGALGAMSTSALWLQMSTVGVDWAIRLNKVAREHGISFVDAPVSGSVGPATSGTLVILASGPVECEKPTTPVFEVMGRIVWLGEAGAGSSAKLVLNNWLADLVETSAEMIRFSTSLGLDSRVIVDLLEGLPLGSPFAVAKARQMLSGDFSPSFALKHALKDVDLALATAHARGVSLLLSESFVESWHRAVDGGLGDRDVSAVFAANR
ncbi:MAG: NAD(P)-dependent oxidoreductase [Acidimicrobiales bacterium]